MCKLWFAQNTVGDAISGIDFIRKNVAAVHPEVNRQLVPILKSQVLVF